LVGAGGETRQRGESLSGYDQFEGHDLSVAFDPAGIITRHDDLLPRSDVGLALIGRQFSIQFPTCVSAWNKGSDAIWCSSYSAPINLA
jgi:hypothetical protein